MYTNSKKLTLALALGAVGVFTQNVSAQAIQSAGSMKSAGVSATKQAIQSTGDMVAAGGFAQFGMVGKGAGYWVHPTGPTGVMQSSLYDSQGMQVYTLEGVLTKTDDSSTIHQAQFGYLEGNLYHYSSPLGPLMIAARVEGLWEKGPDQAGRFLCEIIVATETANPRTVGLLEGSFWFVDPADSLGATWQEVPKAKGEQRVRRAGGQIQGKPQIDQSGGGGQTATLTSGQQAVRFGTLAYSHAQTFGGHDQVPEDEVSDERFRRVRQQQIGLPHVAQGPSVSLSQAPAQGGVSLVPSQSQPLVQSTDSQNPVSPQVAGPGVPNFVEGNVVLRFETYELLQ